jgi:hypothetical protein
MPVKYNWDLKTKLKLTKREFKDWISSELSATIEKHNKTNCTCCDKIGSPHKMSSMRLVCKNEECNKDHLCDVKYKVDKCDNDEIYFVYQYNKHKEGLIPKSNKHGMSNKIKDFINELIYEKDLSKPKKIHVKLSSKKYKNKIDILQLDLSTLQQVQNYVKYLKQKVFESNKRSDVKDFVEENGYNEDINENEFFTFGELLGNGTDEEHFQCGFTSVKLMSRMPEGIVFHCDATYKVVKVGYPLIVFGVSDINRKFYPICFMFTSHEQNQDYVKFFTSLEKLASNLKIVFSPEYICIDASKCMAYAIRKLFPLCRILMCWFHLKANVSNKVNK